MMIARADALPVQWVSGRNGSLIGIDRVGRVFLIKRSEKPGLTRREWLVYRLSVALDAFVIGSARSQWHGRHVAAAYVRAFA